MPTLFVGGTYTREEVHDIFSPATTFTPSAGTWGLAGIVRVPERPGDFVFFVTLGQQQGDHAFDESINVDGVLTWQSQPSQTLTERRIVEFINHEFKRLKDMPRDVREHCGVLDTLTLARKLHPGQRNSLDALAKRYNVDNSKRELHGALLDAQILADIYTYIEHRGSIKGKTVAWIGDSNNVCNTWLQAAEVLGFNVHVSTPPGYEVEPERAGLFGTEDRVEGITAFLAKRAPHWEHR